MYGTYRIQVTPVVQPSKPEDKTLPTVPEHRLYLFEENGRPAGIYENEHGRQTVGNLLWGGELLCFTAFSGSLCDELFIYRLFLKDGRITGEAFQPGYERSPVEGELIEG